MANVIKTEIKGPKCVITGITSEGIEIRAVFRAVNGTYEKMITAYPDFK